MEEPPVTLSKQQRYQQRKLAKGLCITCGKRPLHPDSKCQCWVCGTKRRVAQRRKLGLKPGTAKLKRPVETQFQQAA